MPEKDLPDACLRFREACMKQGFEPQISVMPDSTRTAEEAAAAVGTTAAQIVKSLVFADADTGEPLMFLVSGKNRLDEKKVLAATGRKVARADAGKVRDATGFAIGGIPPFGHTTRLPTWIDEDLLAFAVVHAAAGTPSAIFEITPSQLQEIGRANVIALAR